MRFDLEIPSIRTDMCFIKDGNTIPNMVAPLYYINMDLDDNIPSDFITVNSKYLSSDILTGSYEVVAGPLLEDVKSSKFLITNISKYSFKRNTKIPLFYRHFIPYIIKEESISIVDYYGVQLDTEDYLIIYEDSGTYVYLNKVNKVLFIQYVSENKIKKELLNIVEAFQEVDWQDLLEGPILPKNKYLYRDGTIDTSHDEDLYITYLNNSKLFRKPLGNIEDQWFVSILNCTMKDGNNIYQIPEYYNQGFNSDNKYKFIEKKKCIKTICKKSIQYTR